MTVGRQGSTPSLQELFCRELPGKPRDRVEVILLVHRQADPDALCSASGLSAVLRNAFPGLTLDFRIVVPQGASSLGVEVCRRLGIKFDISVDEAIFERCDFLVVLDTGDIRLLEPYVAQVSSSQATKVLIDHHASSTSLEGWHGFKQTIVDARATSVCEMIANGFSAEFLDVNTAKVLLAGLLFDSQHLGLATESTLVAALNLVRAGTSVEEAKSVLRRQPDRSETLAKIKSAQRLQFEEFNGFVFIKTEVSSFHASVARMLLEIGAEVGIAFGKSEGEARVSIRSTQSFHRQSGIDLGSLLKDISDKNGLVGGGHATAASISGDTDPRLLADELIESLKKLLKK